MDCSILDGDVGIPVGGEGGVVGIRAPGIVFIQTGAVGLIAPKGNATTAAVFPEAVVCRSGGGGFGGLFTGGGTGLVTLAGSGGGDFRGRGGHDSDALPTGPLGAVLCGGPGWKGFNGGPLLPGRPAGSAAPSVSGGLAACGPFGGCPTPLG